VSRAQRLELGAIVVGAGSATRFGGADKILAQLGGRPVLEYALRMLSAEREVASIVVVLGQHTLRAGGELVATLGLRDVVLCEGGATRGDSVRAGLRRLDPEIELVAVHDAARPLASAALLRSVVAAARVHGAAVPALPVPDTLSRLDMAGFVQQAVERANLASAQTPQVARRDWLEAALASAPEATDEASALVLAGYPVATTPGERHNLKLTWPDDLPLAEALLASRSAPV
jgi:2-C-methyl-D-erythritol 4-phosphate cytidylyltransferase